MGAVAAMMIILVFLNLGAVATAHQEISNFARLFSTSSNLSVFYQEEFVDITSLRIECPENKSRQIKDLRESPYQTQEITLHQPRKERYAN